MRRRILGKIGLVALATAALMGASGCTTVVDPEARPIPPGLAFDREQVDGDIPLDTDIELSDYVEGSFRLVDDSTVDGVEFYIAQSREEGMPFCVVLVRPGTPQFLGGCGPVDVTVNGGGFPTTEFSPYGAVEAERDGWVNLGREVWVIEQ